MKKDFTKISLHSKLFKGRSSWYFCYLKSEKLAHVLAVLAGSSVSEIAGALQEVATFAARITQDLVYTAAGEVSEEALLASLFSMTSMLRLETSRGHLEQETAKLLVEEYEAMIEKLGSDDRSLGLVVSAQDLAISAVEEEPLFTALPSPLGFSNAQASIKDIYKGHSRDKGQKDAETLIGQKRTALILDCVRKGNGVSIKEISLVVRGCSEKTIQRELNSMIEQGVVIRKGERRWSTYHPTPKIGQGQG